MELAPTGTVVFLLTDVEGSTRLWEGDPAGMRQALARHDEIVRTAVSSRRGYVFSTAGDSFAIAFWTAVDAAEAAIEIQRRLSSASAGTEDRLQVRAAIHAGAAEERGGDYFGPAVNRTARLMAAAHGGQIVVSDAAHALLAGTAEIELLDLGEHLLKDLSEPERIWGLLADGLDRRFPPLRTRASARHNLPLPRSSFVGRSAEAEQVASRLGTGPLVTLVGPGGVGKTRLALHAAAELTGRFDDGVWLVELSALREGALISGAVLDALNLPRRARPDDAVLLDTLADRHLLLILDNCEHLVEDVAALVDRLLARCRHVRVLATSREVIGLDGEQTLRLEALPAGEDDAAGVRLFCERAQAVGVTIGDSLSERNAVRELCRRLDGLPLAIELAAARLGSMTVEDLLSHLDRRFRLLVSSRRDVPARQRSMQATLEWSYGLLTGAQQDLFDRMAPFAGGFDVEHAVFMTGRDSLDVLDDLSDLVGKSLVVRQGDGAGSTRYGLLETMRELGHEHLRDAALAAVEARLLEWAVALSRTAEPHLLMSEQPWLARIDREIGNIRAALTLGTGDAALAGKALEVAGRLRRYWFHRTFYGEGRFWLARLLEAASDAQIGDRARGLHAFANLSAEIGDATAAGRAAADESVRLLREIDDRGALAWALNSRAKIAFDEPDQARADLVESLVLAREQGDTAAVLADLFITSSWHALYGDLSDAAELVEEAFAISMHSGSDMNLAHAYEYRAAMALHRGDVEQGLGQLGESISFHLRTGNEGCGCHVLETTAFALAAAARFREASELLSRAGRLRIDLHAPSGLFENYGRRQAERLLAAAGHSLPVPIPGGSVELKTSLRQGAQLLEQCAGSDLNDKDG